ncbi:MAG: uracil-DNA glycosylase [Pseudomonadota bacterium]
MSRREYLDALGLTDWVARTGTVLSDPTPAAVVPAAVSPTDAAPRAAVAVPDRAPVDTWALLQHEVSRCTRCRLHETRTQTVFGVGNPGARLMVIGEAPGAEEDRRGEPFVGRAGQLLNAMLVAIGLTREAIFIANAIKCRPPQNRDPRADETASCRGYLEAQIEAIQPEVVMAVGRVAAQLLLDSELTLGKLRGREHELPGHGMPLVVTYHPAYLLRSPAQKRLAGVDLKRVRNLLGQTT